MRIKLDENMPLALVSALETLGHDIDTVSVEGLGGAPDADVWLAAQGAERFLVTQDLDFSDVRQFAPGTHHGLMVVRLNHPSRRNLLARILAVLKTEEIQSWGRFLSSSPIGRPEFVGPSVSVGPPARNRRPHSYSP